MIIETPRLILREYIMADVDAVAAIYADPEGMRFKGGPRPYARIAAMIEATIANCRRDSYGRWATIHKADDRLIGNCGLLHQEVAGQPELEISYHIDRAYWGQGLATEAALAYKDYGFDTLGRHRLISLVDHDNVASQKVALKNGMQHEKDVIWSGRSVWVYAVARVG